MNTTQPLTVYKASAGSGKTFTLAAEFIKLLVIEPTNYRRILAVTFTNKATQEMKTRILQHLYGIANNLADSDDYLLNIRKALPRFSEQAIRERARAALQLLTHDYDNFRIETIDSFFQRILRNLARELGLTANLQVSLNDRDVESQAVDNLIDGIEKESDQLLRWVMDYVSQRVEDGKSWNVIALIKEFGQNIFEDFYKQHRERLREIMSDGAFFKKYRTSLLSLREKALADMKAFGDEFTDLLLEIGASETDFSQGAKGVPSYFKRLRQLEPKRLRLQGGDLIGTAKSPMPNSYVNKALNDPEEMLRKDDRGTGRGEQISSTVGPLLQRAEARRKEAAVTVCSVELTLRNINELRLLGRIEQEVSKINQADNSFLLSGTQKLLKDIIADSDSPFIYEKIGGRISYIMIDEFQDTSSMQWDNFKVLLDECLSHQSGSLVVGDIKQSIYRWRGGDWRLLRDIGTDGEEPANIVQLDTNYRSDRNIVLFNNAFFTLAAKDTADSAREEMKDSLMANPQARIEKQIDGIETAYADVSQKIQKADTTGYVEVTLLPSDEYEENTITLITHALETLLSKGVKPAQIAIIVRRRTEISTFAQHFQLTPISVGDKQVMVKMVSDEAFRLDASPVVKAIVKAMYVLTHPADNLAVAALLKAIASAAAMASGSVATTKDSELFIGKDNLYSQLPEPMVKQRMEMLSASLPDLAEWLLVALGMDNVTSQSAYVSAFLDQLTQWTQNHTGGIDDFLEEWDNSLSAKAVQRDNTDGIRLLTIHKSKGLEKENVIVPFCDWKMEKANSTLWLEPTQNPFNDLPVAPVPLQPFPLKHSIYCEQYMEEHVNNYIDNLNLLYVAFTRAKKNLFIIGRSDKAEYPSATIGSVLEPLHDVLPGSQLWDEPGDGKKKTRHFVFGELDCSDQKQKKETDNIFAQAPSSVDVAVKTYPLKVQFMQSNASKDFLLTDEELEKQEHRQQYIETGNVIHALLANIHDPSEIDRAIDQMEFDGTLYGENLTREQLRGQVKSLLESDPQVADWFSPRWHVFNECTILYYDASSGYVKQVRPDRVITDGNQTIVIDFKTGLPRTKHNEQVSQYMDKLADMGLPDIHGFLWYLHLRRVVPVI